MHITEPSADDDNDGKNENYDDGEGNCDDNDEKMTKKYEWMGEGRSGQNHKSDVLFLTPLPLSGLCECCQSLEQ